MKRGTAFRRVLSLLPLLLAISLLAASLPVSPRAPAQAGEVRTYNVSAIDVVVTLNRFGDHDPEGKMFILDENIPAVRQQEVMPFPDHVSIGLRDDAIQPLVIRANIGDTVVINFTNRLREGRASMHINGLPVDPKTSAGSNVGMNPDTTVAPDQSITYTWFIPNIRNMEGSYIFNSMGDDMRQQMAHGLFGVLNVEPAGSTWLNPIDGQPLKSGWEAMIVDPSGKDFREETLIFHEIGDESFRVLDGEGSPLPLNDDLNEGAYRPASRALNYRSEPFLNRQELVESILGHPDASQNYGSYMFGDIPTPMSRGYLGDPTKRRIVHAGSERFHVDHLHGGSIRWQFDPFDTGQEDLAGGVDFFGLDPTKTPLSQTRSQRLDSQAIGPMETYTEQTEGGAGGLQNVPGDFLWHCHFAHHYVVGMWAFWRAFDTLQTGQPWQIDPNHPLQELPDRRGLTPGAVDSTRLIGMTMPSGRTLTDAPTSDTKLNIDDWIRTKIPPQGDPGPETDYDASVWDWVRVDDAAQLDQLAQQDATIPTLALLRSLGFDPLPSQPLYLSEPETTRVWANYRAPQGAAGKRLPIMFNPSNAAAPAYPLLRPHLGKRPPFSPMRSGSPWSGDTLEGFSEENAYPLVPADARRLEYVKVTIPLDITLNERLGIENDEGALPVLDEDKDDILAGRKPQEQLVVRANVGDGIDVVHYSEIPLATFEFFKSNLHYHFVQFENQASDGVITGLAYEQSVMPYTASNTRLATGAPAGSTAITVEDASRFKVNAFIGVGFGVARRNRDGGNLPGTLNRNGGFEWAQIVARNGNTLTLDRPLENDHTAGQFVSTEFVRQQFYADAESGTTFFHNHVFAVPGFGMALTGALIQEPRGSTWHDPATGEEIRSGAVADIKNVSVSVAPGIPVQDFREFVLNQMDAVTDVGERRGGERGGINMKMEPLDEGDRASDPHLVFSSVKHGDPETPVLRAYVGDLGVIRLLESSGHDIGAFHLEGHRFRLTRFDPNEAAKDTVATGISERFDLFFTAGSVGLQAGDYVFMNAMHEKMLDAWGILRVLDTLQPDLERLGGPNESIRPQDDTTFPQNRPNTSNPPPAPQVSSVAELKAKLEVNGYSLMNGVPVDQIPVRTYDIAAIETEIRLTEGFQKSNGRMYVLAEDEQAVLSGAKDPEPLVIRANVGEIVRVNFTNKLPGDRASFAIPQLIKSADDLGSAFGLNNDSTVAPRDTRNYWYVIDPRYDVPRSFVISDYGDPFEGGANGLYGLFIVEPAGSTYHDPVTGREVKSGPNVVVRTPEGAFRDVALLRHDEDPRMNRDIMPYDKDIDGDRAFNYRAEPMEKRDNKFPAHVLSSKTHGDPGTPVLELEVGEQVRFHAAVGFGNQPHVATIDGHRFPFEPRNGSGLNLYARVVVPKGTFDVSPEGGAGGIMGFPGDYLYRDGRNPFFEGGLWGILRVTPRSESSSLEVNVMGRSSIVPIDNVHATQQELTATSPDGICTITLARGTKLVGPQGILTRLVSAHWNLDPPPAPAGSEIVLAMDLLPEGTQILPAAALVMSYAPLKLPAGTGENDLFIAELDGAEWKEIPSRVDAVARTVTASVDGLVTYALMARVRSSEPPAGPASQVSTGGINWGLVSGIILAAAIVIGALAVYSARRKKAPAP